MLFLLSWQIQTLPGVVLVGAGRGEGGAHVLLSAAGRAEQGGRGDAFVTDHPYGRSKLMTEWMLHDLSIAYNLRYVVLRYFNVAGCDPQGSIGQSTPNATLLVKVACEAAVGRRPHVAIFGTDYPTPDGTGIRDYSHVEDLADAHVKALGYLRRGGDSITLNCGYGHGYSVREVLASVQRVGQTALKVREEPRRPGDPAALVADAARIRKVLDWQPRYDNLDAIVRTSLQWERKQSS